MTRCTISAMRASSVSRSRVLVSGSANSRKNWTTLSGVPSTFWKMLDLVCEEGFSGLDFMAAGDIHLHDSSQVLLLFFSGNWRLSRQASAHVPAERRVRSRGQECDARWGTFAASLA